MITPIPTPFDIIDPGPGAVVPTAIAWIALILISLLVIGLIAIRRRVPTASSINSRLRRLLDELRTGSAGARTPQQLERVARLARRIISPYMTAEVSGMSSGDLRVAAAALQKKQNEMDYSLSQAILLLATIEEQAYAPQESIDQTAALAGILEKLVTSLETHVRRFRHL